MPINFNARVLSDKVLEKPNKRYSLFRRSGVLGFHVLIASPNITHTDAVGIVSIAMRTGSLDRSSGFNGTVQINDIVIAYVTPTIALWRCCSMPTLDVGCFVIAPFRSISAMNDNLRNLSHKNGMNLRAMMMYGAVAGNFSMIHAASLMIKRMAVIQNQRLQNLS